MKMSSEQQMNGQTLTIKRKTEGVEKAIVRYLHGLGTEEEYLEAMETEIHEVHDDKQVEKLRNIRNRRQLRRR